MLEGAGIATVIIASAVFKARLLPMSLPRLVLTPFPMGRPLGAPGDVETQHQTLLAALRLFDSAVGNGAVAWLDLPYRPGLGRE